MMAAKGRGRKAEICRLQDRAVIAVIFFSKLEAFVSVPDKLFGTAATLDEENDVACCALFLWSSSPLPVLTSSDVVFLPYVCIIIVMVDVVYCVLR